jgi:hypothetical protein
MKDYSEASTSLEVEKSYRNYRLIELEKECVKVSDYLNDLIKSFNYEKKSLFLIKRNEFVLKLKVNIVNLIKRFK